MSKIPLTICLLGAAISGGIGAGLKTDLGTGMIVGAFAVMIASLGIYTMFEP